MVAAFIRGVEWQTATIDPDGPYAGYVTYNPDDLSDPLTRAFIFWSGPFAEARHTNRPLDQVCASQSARDDLAGFSSYRTIHRDLEWINEMNAAWSLVEECSARLLLAGTITPHAPDPLRDKAQVAAFLAEYQ